MELRNVRAGRCPAEGRLWPDPSVPPSVDRRSTGRWPAPGPTANWLRWVSVSLLIPSSLKGFCPHNSWASPRRTSSPPPPHTAPAVAASWGLFTHREGGCAWPRCSEQLGQVSVSPVGSRPPFHLPQSPHLPFSVPFSCCSLAQPLSTCP